MTNRDRGYRLAPTTPWPEGARRGAVRSARVDSASTGRPRWKPWARSHPHAASASDLGRTLDALGDGHEPEGVRDLHDGPHEQRSRPAEDVAHERAVDLQQVDRELLQVGERRVAGAEVVDREPHAEVAQPAQADRRRGRVLHERAFGDLEDQPRRLEAGTGRAATRPGRADRASSSWRGATFTLTAGASAPPTRVDPPARLPRTPSRARAGRSRR